MSLFKLLSELYSLVSKVPTELRAAVVGLIRDLVSGEKEPGEIAVRAQKLAVEIAFKKGYT